MKNRISKLINSTIEDIYSVGYIDTEDDQLSFEKSINQAFIQFGDCFLKMKQADLNEGVFVGICFKDNLFLDSSLDEGEVFCSSSMYSALLSTHSYDLTLTEIVMYGENFCQGDVLYCEGIEFQLKSKNGLNV